MPCNEREINEEAERRARQRMLEEQAKRDAAIAEGKRLAESITFLDAVKQARAGMKRNGEDICLCVAANTLFSDLGKMAKKIPHGHGHSLPEKEELA